MTAVLVVEDEKHLADGLRFNLEAEGFQVTIAADGEKALQLLGRADKNGKAEKNGKSEKNAKSGKPEKNGKNGKTEKPSRAFDAVILDVMLPGINGFEVAAKLRERGELLPILMLTARGSSEDVLLGFESGADDYLAKPFELSILLARLQALLRRHQWAHRAIPEGKPEEKPTRRKEDVFRFEGKKIDFAALELSTGRETIPLTQMEAQLLRYLVDHAGEIVSRKAILQDVWGLSEETDTRAIDNFIVRLRKYIEKVPARPEYLQTVRGVGYRFLPKP
jgi:DNA-binding response OmpR family regulator